MVGWRRSFILGPASDTDMSQLHIGQWIPVPDAPQGYGAMEGHAGPVSRNKRNPNLLLGLYDPFQYTWGAPLMKKHDSGRWFQHGMLTSDLGFLCKNENK